MHAKKTINELLTELTDDLISKLLETTFDYENIFEGLALANAIPIPQNILVVQNSAQYMRSKWIQATKEADIEDSLVSVWMKFKGSFEQIAEELDQAMYSTIYEFQEYLQEKEAPLDLEAAQLAMLFDLFQNIPVEKAVVNTMKNETEMGESPSQMAMFERLVPVMFMLAGNMKGLEKSIVDQLLDSLEENNIEEALPIVDILFTEDIYGFVNGTVGSSLNPENLHDIFRLLFTAFVPMAQGLKEFKEDGRKEKLVEMMKEAGVDNESLKGLRLVVDNEEIPTEE